MSEALRTLFRAGAVTAALLALIPVSAAADIVFPEQAPDVPWPSERWPEGSLPDTVDRDRFAAAAQAARGGADGPFGETRALLVIHGGRIVHEWYRDGFGPDTRLLSWSMAKSITQGLTGLAVMDGVIDRDETGLRPEWQGADDPRAAISVDHLLTMTSGLDWREIGYGQTETDAAHALYGVGRADQAAYTAAKPLAHTPGSTWTYSTGGVTLLARIVQDRLFPDPDLTGADRRGQTLDYLTTRLFEPLGMTDTVPEFDASGTFVGGALVYATARDFARFGLLYLRDGLWDGTRLLPENWADLAGATIDAEGADIYGALWWTNPDGGSEPFAPLLVNGPHDAFAAQGNEGQLTLVVPSKDLVIVRLGYGVGDIWPALGASMGAIVETFPDYAPPADDAAPDTADAVDAILLPGTVPGVRSVEPGPDVPDIGDPTVER